MTRDNMREEWLAWQDVVDALETLGISRDTLNADGDALVHAIRYWHWQKSRLEDFLNIRGAPDWECGTCGAPARVPCDPRKHARGTADMPERMDKFNAR